MSFLSAMWICPRSIFVGTGTTTAKSFGAPPKSLAMVITVLSPSRTSTTCEARLNREVPALAT